MQLGSQVSCMLARCQQALAMQQLKRRLLRQPRLNVITSSASSLCLAFGQYPDPVIPDHL